MSTTYGTSARETPIRSREDGPRRARRKFLRIFPGGFYGTKYLEWERNYKREAHERWEEELGASEMRRLFRARAWTEAASRAVRIESRTNLLFSFEKMALRDAVRNENGARAFSEGIYALLHGRGAPEARFEAWVETIGGLPRRQTRVLTWPVATVFPFLAQPATHVFLKPNVTRNAARAYGVDFVYASRPSWNTYASLLAFAEELRGDLADLAPRDMIDIQSFIWVLGSEEYA